MAITSDNDPELTTTAVVTIRIPSGADSDILTDAEERLSRAEGIDTVTIDELRSLSPKLSATVVTVDIRLRWTTAMTDGEVKCRLAEVPGLESIEQINRE
jgi:hypothetical protein